MHRHEPTCRRALAGWMGETTPPCTCGAAFHSDSAALAASMGLPEGFHVVRLIGTVNGPIAPLTATKPDRLQLARHALQQTERRTTHGERR